MIEADLEDLADLDADTLLVASRMVQESLTNVLRHAPGAAATVRVRRTSTGLDVVVSNTGATGPGSGPGSSRGLAGIRGRIVAVAGWVSWGPEPDGGFAVRAHLPGSFGREPTAASTGATG